MLGPHFIPVRNHIATKIGSATMVNTSRFFMPLNHRLAHSGLHKHQIHTNAAN